MRFVRCFAWSLSFLFLSAGNLYANFEKIPMEVPVRYLERMMDLPNDHRVMQQYMTEDFRIRLHLHPKHAPLVTLLSHHLESASLDINLSPFNFYLMAYRSGDEALRARAIELLRSRWNGNDQLFLSMSPPGFSNPQDRHRHFMEKFVAELALGSLNHWNRSNYVKHEEKLKQLARDAAEMLALVIKIEPHIDEFLDRQQDFQDQPFRRLFVEHLYFSTLGQAFAESKKRYYQEKRFQSLVMKLRSVGRDESHNLWFSSEELELFSEQKHRTEIIAELERVIPYLMLPQHFAQAGRVLLIAYSLDSQTLRDKVRNTLRYGFLEREMSDQDIEKLQQYNYRYDDSEDQEHAYRAGLSEEIGKEARRNRDLKTHEGRTNYLFDLFSHQFRFSRVSYLDQAIDLLQELAPDYSQHADRMENLLYGFNGSRAELAQAYISRMKGKKYAKSSSAKALSRLMELWMVDRGNQEVYFHNFFLNHKELVRFISEHLSTSSELREKIKHHLVNLTFDEHESAPFLLISYHSGDHELMDLAVETGLRLINANPNNPPQEGGYNIGPHRRLFDQVVQQYRMNEDFYSLSITVEFLDKLELNYAQIAPSIEQEQLLTYSHQQGELIIEYVRTVKGEEFLQNLLTHLSFSENAGNLVHSMRNIRETWDRILDGEAYSGDRTQLINTARHLIRNAHFPDVRDFVQEHFSLVEDPATQDLFAWLIVAAIATEEPSLMERAAELSLKIISQDPVGGLARVYGFMLEAEYPHTQSTPYTYPNAKNFHPLVRKSLIEMNVPYDLVRDHVESRLSMGDQSYYGKFLEEFVLKEMGQDHLEHVTTSEPPLNKRFTYINGGYSKMSNYSANETDMMSFHKNLFYGKAQILNAAGPDGTYVVIEENGTQARDTDGIVKHMPSHDPGVPVRQATKENVLATLEEVAKDKPDEATFVFGGHGGVDAISLWNGGILGYLDIRKKYDLFPEDTLIRTLYLQCYASSTIVFHKRSKPKVMSRFAPFAHFHYPENHCAMSTSAIYELGKFFTWGQTWENSRWTQLFKTQPAISLEGVQDHMFEQSQMPSTPVVTSDIFVQDVRETFCGEFNHMQNNVTQFGEEIVNWPASEQRLARKSWFFDDAPELSDAIDKLCGDSKDRTDRKEKLVEYRRLLKIWNSLKWQHIDWAKELAVEIDEDAAEAHRKALEEVDAYMESKKLPGGGFRELTPEEYAYVKHLKSGHNTRFGKVVEAVTRSQDHVGFFNQKMEDYLNHDPVRAEKLKPFYHEGWRNPDFKGSLITAIQTRVANQAQQVQKQIKWINARLRLNDREKVEKLLTYPAFEEIGQRLEAIRKCEKSPLN